MANKRKELIEEVQESRRGWTWKRAGGSSGGRRQGFCGTEGHWPRNGISLAD